MDAPVRPRPLRPVKAEAVPPQRSRGGFTLIEVLMAMVIMAVGLLSVAALGLVAAKSLIGAEVRSQFAVTASQDLELALQELRNGSVPQSSCVSVPPFGDRLSREVNPSNPSLPRVTVTVRPGTGRSIPLQAFTVTRTVYRDSAIPLIGTDDGTPCS